MRDLQRLKSTYTRSRDSFALADISFSLLSQLRYCVLEFVECDLKLGRFIDEYVDVCSTFLLFFRSTNSSTENKQEEET